MLSYFKKIIFIRILITFIIILIQLSIYNLANSQVNQKTDVDYGLYGFNIGQNFKYSFEKLLNIKFPKGFTKDTRINIPCSQQYKKYIDKNIIKGNYNNITLNNLIGGTLSLFPSDLYDFISNRGLLGLSKFINENIKIDILFRADEKNLLNSKSFLIRFMIYGNYDTKIDIYNDILKVLQQRYGKGKQNEQIKDSYIWNINNIVIKCFPNDTISFYDIEESKEFVNWCTKEYNNEINNNVDKALEGI